jgi:hypothetical protein
MSLLEWLGKDEPVSLPPLKEKAKRKPKTKGAKEVVIPDRIVLGVIGTRSSMRYEDLEENIINPVLEAWGRPDEVIAPDEGESSHVVLAWAQKNDIPVRLYSCDWVKRGRTAGMIRNNNIQRDASHLVLLQGPRSNTLTQLAIRLHGKGRPVVISERPEQCVKSVSSM